MLNQFNLYAYLIPPTGRPKNNGLISAQCLRLIRRLILILVNGDWKWKIEPSFNLSKLKFLTIGKEYGLKMFYFPIHKVLSNPYIIEMGLVWCAGASYGQQQRFRSFSTFVLCHKNRCSTKATFEFLELRNVPGT